MAVRPSGPPQAAACALPVSAACLRDMNHLRACLKEARKLPTAIILAGHHSALLPCRIQYNQVGLTNVAVSASSLPPGDYIIAVLNLDYYDHESFTYALAVGWLLSAALSRVPALLQASHHEALSFNPTVGQALFTAVLLSSVVSPSIRQNAAASSYRGLTESGSIYLYEAAAVIICSHRLGTSPLQRPRLSPLPHLPKCPQQVVGCAPPHLPHTSQVDLHLGCLPAMQVSPYSNSAARLAPFLSLGLGLSFFVVLCVALALLRRSVERHGWPWRWASCCTGIDA